MSGSGFFKLAEPRWLGRSEAELMDEAKLHRVARYRRERSQSVERG
jgi:hypothetical protein